MTVKPCSVADCAAPHVARGWCEKHYKELFDRGSCDAPGCEEKKKVRDWCYAHYNRWRRHGDPQAGGPVRPRAKNGEGGYRNGYKTFVVNGESVYQHREVMAEVIGRPLYPFEHVHHMNGIRDDNRPENLELWTVRHPRGQRVRDLVRFVAENYKDEVLEEINRIGEPI